MTDAQRKWTSGKCEQIRKQIEERWPLSDKDWELVAETIEKLVQQSKDNPEVRKALFDVIEPYDAKAWGGD